MVINAAETARSLLPAQNWHTETGSPCHHFVTYGLTCDDYDDMHERAGGCCEICRTPEADTVRGILVIDHFQTSKVWFVRGLLCDKCNAVMSVHDKRSHPSARWRQYAKQAAAYHAKAWGRPTPDEIALAAEDIATRTPWQRMPRMSRT